MKKVIASVSIIALIFTLYSCGQSATPPTPQTFSGTIHNGEVDTVYLFKGDDTYKLALNSNQFSDTLELEAGYYELKIGDEYTGMYWDSAYQITLTIDLERFDESILYSGYGSAENNALVKSYLIEEKLAGGQLYVLDETTFMDSLMIYRDMLKSTFADSNMNQSFAQDQKDNADYGYNFHLYRYPSLHPYLTRNDSFELSETYFDNLLEFDKNDDQAYENLANYRNLISAYSNSRMRELNEAEDDLLNNIKTLAAEFESPFIKDKIIDNYSYVLLMPDDKIDANYDFLSTNVKDTILLNKYAQAFEKLDQLRKGMDSPSFENYENHAGGTTSLADLRGKFTYIDVWATWCGPCIREIPALKEVEEDYHDANIQFVSISVDREDAHDKWMSMVSEKELGGIQLFASDSWESDFIESYYIKGIPRFILLDPEGKIVSADAPRPSDPKLRELLDEHLQSSS